MEEGEKQVKRKEPEGILTQIHCIAHEPYEAGIRLVITRSYT